MRKTFIALVPAPDFRSPRQAFGEGHPLRWRVRNRGRHHLVPLQGKRFRLQRVVVVVIVVLVLASIIGLVGIFLVEGVQVVLFDQRLDKKDTNFKNVSMTEEAVRAPKSCVFKPKKVSLQNAIQ